MRPVFTVHAICTSDELMEAFRCRLDQEGEDVVGDFSARHGVLRITQSKRRFFTPCLDLTIEDLGDGEVGADPRTTKLWGVFSPRPEIWTGFVFSIGTLIILSIFAVIYGIAQLVLGHLPFALLVPVIASALAALLYVSALVGQGLSISDMYRLRAFVDDCLREVEGTSSTGLRTARESSQL